MIELLVQRQPSKGNATLGTLAIDGSYFCHTLEDQIREVPGQPVSAWKIKGQTAISEGRYRLTLETSNRFGPDTFTVNAVKGFDYIRVHSGNTHEHTDGCLLVGQKSNATTVAYSKPTLLALKDLLVARMKAGEEAWITYCNP